MPDRVFGRKCRLDAVNRFLLAGAIIVTVVTVVLGLLGSAIALAIEEFDDSMFFE